MIRFLKLFLLLGVTISLVGCGNSKFHCRITDTVDYETKESLDFGLFSVNEFIVSTDKETNIYHAGEVQYFPLHGALIKGTEDRRNPFIVISKMDYTFGGMYLFADAKYGYPNGLGMHVSGICKKISIF